MTAVYILMGVSGSGKSTVGQALAARLGCPFYDGDDFHPAQNVAKMAAGAPLTDADRAPWLDRLAGLIGETLERGDTAVIACSALKKIYRDRLHVSGRVQFIYLHGSPDLIWQRMRQRANHYMKAGMLHSQFATLEAPTAQEAWPVSIDRPVSDIVDQILQRLAGKSELWTPNE